MSMKNSNDTIRNRTPDLPAVSALPQPTAPPRAPHFIIHDKNRRQREGRRKELCKILSLYYVFRTDRL
jgi:hypothetical protein